MGIKAGNVIQAKAGTIARSDTTAKKLFELPSGAMVTGVKLYGGLSSGAATGAISVGITGAETDIVNAVSVHAAYAADLTLNASGTTPFARTSSRVMVNAKFAGDDNAGGPWTIVVEYL